METQSGVDNTNITSTNLETLLERKRRKEKENGEEGDNNNDWVSETPVVTDDPFAEEGAAIPDTPTEPLNSTDGPVIEDFSNVGVPKKRTETSPEETNLGEASTRTSTCVDSEDIKYSEAAYKEAKKYDDKYGNLTSAIQLENDDDDDVDKITPEEDWTTSGGDGGGGGDGGKESHLLALGSAGNGGGNNWGSSTKIATTGGNDWGKKNEWSSNSWGGNSSNNWWEETNWKEKKVGGKWTYKDLKDGLDFSLMRQEAESRGWKSVDEEFAIQKYMEITLDPKESMETLNKNTGPRIFLLFFLFFLL